VLLLSMDGLFRLLRLTNEQARATDSSRADVIDRLLLQPVHRFFQEQNPVSMPNDQAGREMPERHRQSQAGPEAPPAPFPSYAASNSRSVRLSICSLALSSACSLLDWPLDRPSA